MRNLSLALRLSVIVAVVVLMLSVVNVFTRDRIAEQELLEGESVRAQLLNGSFTKLEDDLPEDLSRTVTAVYRAEENGETVGYCFDVAVNGFGGALKMIVAIRTDRGIAGVRVLRHSETVGIGSEVADPQGAYLLQYQGLSVDQAENVAAVSGATVSSEAIRKGVSAAKRAFDTVFDGKGE